MTYQEQLTEIQTAISNLVSGGIQSYSFGGRSVTKLDLDTLYREEARLRPLAAQEARRAQGGGRFMKAQVR